MTDCLKPARAVSDKDDEVMIAINCINVTTATEEAV